MERQIPKNVRQIGNVSDSPKIYVEDYVDTFFLQLSEKSEKEKQPEGAFLIGEMQKQDNEEYIYIYGAIKIKELKKEGGEYLINDKIWKCGCEECSQYFEEGEIIGWFVTEHDLQLAPGSINVKLHKKLFPKKNTVLVMKDSSNQEDVFFVHKLGDLMEIGGHYTYYEKNPCMQNYMIASRKKNGTVQTESVEDTAAQSFRSLVRERGGQKRERRTGSLMYGIRTCLVLVLIVMGVSMMNNFSKMKSLQNKINVVAEGEKQTSSPDVKETSGAATTMDKNQEAADTEKESKEITEENEGEEQTEDKNTESVPVSGTAVAADENDDMIGRIGLEYKEENKENGTPDGYYLGYAILPKWRKKGLAAKAASRLLKYCFEYWQLNLLCSSENMASVKTALACGFTKMSSIEVSIQNSVFLQDIVEHCLNDCACVSTSLLFLFARKAL